MQIIFISFLFFAKWLQKKLKSWLESECVEITWIIATFHNIFVIFIIKLPYHAEFLKSVYK